MWTRRCQVPGDVGVFLELPNPRRAVVRLADQEVAAVGSVRGPKERRVGRRQRGRAGRMQRGRGGRFWRRARLGAPAIARSLGGLAEQPKDLGHLSRKRTHAVVQRRAAGCCHGGGGHRTTHY